jgi:hypothetical protein
VVSGGVVLAPGCYGRNCQGDTATFGVNPGEGDMIDPNIWESNPQQQPYLPFPRQRVYIFDLNALGGRTPAVVIPYIAGRADPYNGANETIGAGNPAEIANVNVNHVEVKNDTCSDYFLRLVLVMPSGAPNASLDAGAPPIAPLPDASATDASPD